jgi:hypothetical protein
VSITFNAPDHWSPWLIAENLVCVAIVVVAAIQAWRSSERVVAENRARTRIWRLFVTIAVGISINGFLLPLGAVYALLAYTPKSKRPPTRLSRQTAAWLGVESDE